MRFEWDEKKDKLNQRKHGIPFAVAMEIFADPFCLTTRDVSTDVEERLLTFGRLQNLSVLVVVHTIREEHGEETIRMISARKATPQERKLYEEAE